MAQEHKQPNRGSEEQADTVESAPADQATKDQLDEDIDAILDEIDEVLEENAEEFVRSYVQKGGQ